jgi:ClpP class serine protease
MALDDSEDDEIDDEPSFDEVAGLGVLQIHGALTYRPVDGMCGAVGCSYTELLEDAEEMLNAGVTTIVMDIDSGGGQGYGAFECANELRAMCDEYGATLIAYNDGCMASAAYVLGCVADEVVSNPYAESGSIGVLIALVNDSKHLEQEGYSRQFVTAGASKIPFEPDGSFRAGFIEDLQAKVDSLYNDFVSHVSKYTGLDDKTIRDTEAKMFSATDALSIGLINKIMSRSEFTSYIVNKHKGALDA